MNTRRLLAVAVLATLPLTACTDADDPDGAPDTGAIDTASDVTSEVPAGEDTDAAGDSGSEVPDQADPDAEPVTDTPEPADPDDEPATDAPDPAEPADEDPVESTPAAAALFFDGQQVPVAEACNGVDGAVVASTEGEVTIQAVLEGSETAMRYMAEGEELYIEDVTTSEVGATTVYEGTFEPAESEPFDVRFEVGDTSELDDCA